MKTLIPEHRFIYSWFLITKQLNIFGSISQHVLCCIEKFTMRKNILLEIMKCTFKFANSQNNSVTDSP